MKKLIFLALASILSLESSIKCMKSENAPIKFESTSACGKMEELSRKIGRAISQSEIENVIYYMQIALEIINDQIDCISKEAFYISRLKFLNTFIAQTLHFKRRNPNRNNLAEKFELFVNALFKIWIIDMNVAMKVAAKNNFIYLVEKLIDKGANANNSDALKEAALHGNTDMIGLLVKHGANAEIVFQLALHCYLAYRNVSPSLEYYIESFIPPQLYRKFALWYNAKTGKSVTIYSLVTVPKPLHN